jgi:hypothetical protein
MIRIFGIVAILLGIHVVAEPAAHAQRAPDMATLDRGDGISKLGIDLGLTFLDLSPYDEALRIELFGQYVTRSGLGFYGALPLARSFGAPDAMEDPEPPDLVPNNATAVGNLELGGLYVATMSPRFSWVFRGGVALPIGTSGRDSAATLVAATFPRLTDLALASDAWYLRLGVSPLIYFDKLFIRADLGFDLGFDDDDVAGDEIDLFRINVGAGVDLGVVALSLELVNLATLDDFGDDETFVHTLALTARFMGESLQPFLTVGAPLDESRRDVATLFVAGGISIVP